MQTDHPVVSQAQWDEARKALLEREKAYTHLRDELAAQRRALPWVRIDKPYVFEGPHGKVSLADLFEGRSQLIVQHFMLGPEWEEGCPGCSFGADHIGGALVHLAHRDVSYVAVSRAPMEKIAAFKQRMGWEFEWVSSFGSDFNYDFHVSFTPEEQKADSVYYNYRTSPWIHDELPGHSVFYKDDEGRIFHTYSTYGRGFEEFLLTYMCLDLTPKGRDEDERKMMGWMRHHDKYDDAPKQHAEAEGSSCCSHEKQA
ncbi:Thioredoxin domain-containing protein [Pararobbsia alpina]|uniref:DUF899 domain-containing protein n=1 Tax=Pararobbsia alpina TaxID=621374 RepID=UPI0039A5F284